MTLGEKLKAARLEAGLSQRELCGDTITRNMLSQIENGTAKPSLATLKVLCARLHKPVSQFVEGYGGENLSLLHSASSMPPREALATLEAYCAPDPILDGWFSFLTARCYMALSEEALGQGRKALAEEYAHRAEQAGASEQPLLKQSLALLKFAIDPKKADCYASLLPDNTREQLLRAKAALLHGDTEKCLACLQSADYQTTQTLLLKGEALLSMGQYARAISCFQEVEQADPEQVYPQLEQCYRELGDFENAYRYACLQRK